MTERPILFSGPMVRAILEGRKTQTRRIAIPKRSCIDFIGGAPKDGPDWNDPACWGFEDVNTGVWWALRGDDQCRQLPCPHGEPGDHLWVRESFWGCDAPGYGDQPCVVYDDEWHGKQYHPAEIRPWARRFGRIPSIHMPRDCSRITLEVTSVRVERLQDISESDARAEGVTIEDHHTRGYCAGADRPPSIRAFRDLWDGLNAARGHGWDANPWVWAVEFRRVIAPAGAEE
ncbi:hypothetical protein [Burkholderia ubonensis]|uniref:hypothetical protein n=1 Tax=Burkholderia ubonensis TaxID=101571 RepID=UPI0008FEAE83|nr:hypothetical protein [Burkholderia ubonensis]OJB11856.1 hypothetical protein BGV48_12735 [Burkholderia ubonensis]